MWHDARAVSGFPALGGTLVVAPVPTSVGAARRYVGERLRRAGFDDDLVDTAVLLVSELVTNAVLHANTEVEVRVEVARGARIEVVDSSERSLVRRDHGTESVTGRGLELVEMLSSGYGVRADAARGKAVWFTLGAADDLSPDAWVDSAADAVRPGTVRPAAVAELRHLPVVMYEVLQEHNEALLREYALWVIAHAAGEGFHRDEVAAAERARSVLVACVRRRLSNEPADAPPPEHVDVPVEVEPEDLPAIAQLGGVFADAERLAMEGKLLTRPALPELRTLREWCFDQLVGQLLEGRLPEPWRHPDHDIGEPVGPSATVDTSWVDSTRRAVIVADDGNRIIGVSPAAAALLGWSPDELTGQRIVAIIPRRLRDAHVAGFTRQLMTGRTSIIGRGVELTALHRSGREVAVTLTLERVPAGRGVVFHGWLEPVDVKAELPGR